jgi:hypothetical protein
MYLMYVDESGDSGLVNSPTRYFALSGVVVHELRWQTALDQIIAFRRRMRLAFGLKLREEIHASAFISSPGALMRIKRNDRLTILRLFAEELAKNADLRIINVLVDKQGKQAGYDVFGMAWKALLQRFHNTMQYRNFPGPRYLDERGLVFPDATDDKKLRLLMRQVRRYNPVPNQPAHGLGYRNIVLDLIIEDPLFRNSADSYFTQAADLAAFFLYQSIQPNAFIHKKTGHGYLSRLQPILLTQAAKSDPMGIVRF